MKDFDVLKLTQKQLNTYFGASVKQDDGMALFWLEAGADVNSRFEDEPVLLYAIRNENEELANKFIDLGADVNARDSSKEPILFSVLHDVKWLNVLAKGNLDINVKKSNGENAFSVAYKNDKEDIADRLVELGISIDGAIVFNDVLDICAPILIACVSWYKGRWLDKVLSLNVNVDVRDEDGYSALFFAVRRQNEDALDKLIEAGANVNLKDYDGSTALMCARKLSIADKLIKYGAKIDLRDDLGYTALSRQLEAYSSWEFHRTEETEKICELLIKNSEGLTKYDREIALSFARKAKNKNLIRLIKEYM